MPIHRKRFRIEEAFNGDMPITGAVDGDIGPMHREIMTELRAIRAEMASPGHGAATESSGASISRGVADAQALLETYRAQIEQCEKLKVELDLIHDAINRTKREIAVLHGKSFDGNEMAKVTGELGGSAQPGTQVGQATSDTLEVEVNLDPSQQREVKKGDRAQITLPGNTSATGTVDRLGRVAQVPTGQDNTAGATIPAYISLDHPQQAHSLDQAPVQVEITTKGVANALSVPVTAIVGRSGGGFAVEVVGADGRRKLVAVKLGLFDTAGGRVQVVEGDLREGDQVVVPSS